MMNLFKEDHRITKIFGPPGTGKTTWILNKVDELLEQGVKPNRIALVSFTNKAVDEFIDRSLKRFSKYTREDFPWFRTIHSLCNKCGDGRKILSQQDLNKFARSLGLEVSNYISLEDNSGTKPGDRLIQMENLARLKMISLKQAFDENDTEFSFSALEFWKQEYDKFKQERKVVDFTDLLSNFNSVLDVDYFFIDEAQDLSLLQWKVMEKAAANALEIYIAGDDDQSIYSFAGADQQYFLDIYDENDIVLSKSYRLPIKIFNKSKEILKNIKNRKEKNYVPNTNIEGSIKYISSLNDINFCKKESYLILLRNRWLAKNFSEELKEQGVPFLIFGQNSMGDDLIKAILCWEDWRKNPQASKSIITMLSKYCGSIRGEIPLDMRDVPWYEAFDLVDFYEKEYIRECLKNGFKLTEVPNIVISTIHQAKGGEADNVIIVPTVSASVYDNIESENEHRVWYVAVTRAKSALYLIFPQNLMYYEL